jgi:NADPH:quinone reductase-like Zn-dependent oxidoreductase
MRYNISRAQRATAGQGLVMRAIAQDRYGSADVLELVEIDTPKPSDGEVLVRVEAASVNALDWHFMRGSPLIARPAFGLRRPTPAIRGVDVAGFVGATGKSVTQLQPGASRIRQDHAGDRQELRSE